MSRLRFKYTKRLIVLSAYSILTVLLSYAPIFTSCKYTKIILILDDNQ